MRVEGHLSGRIWFVPFLFWAIPFLDSVAAKPAIKLGVDHLEDRAFDVLRGKRVGLLTHPAGKNSMGRSTVMVLKQSPLVRLTALFGPEHGIYGDEKASVPVDDKVDDRTGLPVYSLYGKYRKPTKEMLGEIDCLVIDLQDVGVRCYTYVSCMRYAMEACFENKVEVVVLDRPNPLGGLKLAGPMIDPEWISYVGAFPMPFVHGMTIAELALWAKKTPGILKVDDSVRKSGRLLVVPMKGWKRSMTWPATGLDWHATSPNIPTLDAVAGYPMTGLGAQLGKFKHGIGTEFPFRLLSFEGKQPEELLQALQKEELSGLSFKILRTKDSSGKTVEGVYVVIRDWSSWKPTELAFAMMRLSVRWQTPSPFSGVKDSERKLFNKHVGSSAWWNRIEGSAGEIDPGPFLDKWDLQAQSFRKQVSHCLLY